MKQLAFAIIGSLLFLASCNKDEDEVTVVGDVYVVSQLSGEDVVYGLSIHAYSLDAFASVTVNSNSDPGVTYHLEAYPGFKTDFYYDTPEDELSTEKPVTGTYHFTATFESGEVLTDDDVLATDVLIPPVIKTSDYDVTNSKAVVEWETVTGADLYVIKLYDDDELVFLSPAIDPNYKKVEFTSGSSSWGQEYVPVAGTSFKLVLSAFKYETNGDSYNVQASTSNESTLIWGE
ncbi:MAG: hypothetical protein RBS73_05835 [Prolixibacteraceae bacterium]|jgi:hypothetical protein|nr:hypothetical protein [Prolixibacteraceae bacterium]